MSHLRHTGPRHIHLPDDTISNPNRTELEKFSRGTSNYPFCVGATGDPGVIANGAPGVASFVTWIPPTNPLYDIYHMIFGFTTIRIPLDGFYSFWMNWQCQDAITVDTEIKTFMDYARTSETGFAAPVWLRYTNLIRYVPANPGFSPWWDDDFRGLELHANDLVRFGIQLYATLPLISTLVGQSEFKFESPIPVDR